MIWSWKRDCHLESAWMVRACFDTADLYDLMMVDNEPDFGEMAAMASFFRWGWWLRW
jgi:hypothetical protein